MLPLRDRLASILRSKYLPLHNRGILVPKEPATIGGHLRRRRLQLRQHQSKVAEQLGVSTVTLSKWERDRIYPSWDHQPQIADFLGYNPFTNPALGGYKSNETLDVASLSSKDTANAVQRFHKLRILLRKNRTQCAKELRISARTIWNWETNRRSPSPKLQKKLSRFLEQVEHSARTA